MKAGRPAIPTELHKQRGTYSPARHGRARAGEPKPTADLHDAPPDGLNANQRAEWRHQLEYFPRGVIKEADRRWLMIWVKAADRWDLATTTLQREAEMHPQHPMQAIDRFGVWHVSPLIGVIAQAEAAMSKATAELGYSPAARTRIHTGPVSEAPAEAAWGGKLAA